MPIKPDYGTKKIAVLRANELGDFIVVLPALQALKSTYPQAEIVLLAKPWTESYLRKRPSPIDRVIPVPVSTGVRLETGIEENIEDLKVFFDSMKKEHFDLALQLHGGGKYSNPFVVKLGARITAGSRTDDALPLDRTIPYLFYQNEVLRYLEVVSLVGARGTVINPRIETIPSDIDEVSSNIPELREKYIVLHPGASDRLRRWPPQFFADVGDALSHKGWQIVLTGVFSEKEVVDEVASRMKRKVVNACDRLSLGGLTGLLSQASLLIANDTGPLHLAQALNAKTIGIFWAHNVINWGPVTSTGNRLALSWITKCPICGINLTGTYKKAVSFPVCDHDFSLTANISPQEVLFSAFHLLSNSIMAS